MDQLIINCTGLAARDLIPDPLLYPVHGQIVKVAPVPNISCIAADFPFGTGTDKIAYVIPRKDCLVLGGTAIKHFDDLNSNPEITTEIIERCKQIAPKLNHLKIQSVEVGLRPGRSEIRIERVGNIIHNYGHGGAGFTVSWGCANQVIQLIKNK